MNGEHVTDQGLAPRGFASYHELQRRDYIIAALRGSVRWYRLALAVSLIALAAVLVQLFGGAL